MSNKESIKVVLRVRPLNSQQTQRGNLSIIQTHNTQCFINDSQGIPKSFTYDAVYSPNSSQQQIYGQMAYPLVQNVIQGYNGTIFAYGQTGCGKTFTMLGLPNDPQNQGIIPNSFSHIFEYISQAPKQTIFLVRCSYLQIYNQKIRDLLQYNPNLKLELKESKQGIFVKDLTMLSVKSTQDIEKAMQSGNSHRITGETKMNAHSSRSHAIFTIYIETSQILDSREVIRTGKLNLVDLAGSERQKKTEAVGERLREAIKINYSLSALGNVINALVENHKHIPYRDSKLTLMLQDSLGGNTKTVMIAVVSPAQYNYQESLSTLRYASRAKFIKNKPRINQDPKDALIREYASQIQKLKDLLGQYQTGEPIVIEKIVQKVVEVPILPLQESHYSDDFQFQQESPLLLKQSFTEGFSDFTLNVTAPLQQSKQEKLRLEENLKNIQLQLLKGGEEIQKSEHKRLQAQKNFRAKFKKQKKREKAIMQEAQKHQQELLALDSQYQSLQEQVQDLRRLKLKLRKRYQICLNDIQDTIKQNGNQFQILVSNLRDRQDELSFYRKAFQALLSRKQINKLKSSSDFDEINREWHLPNISLQTPGLNFPTLPRTRSKVAKQCDTFPQSSKSPNPSSRQFRSGLLSPNRSRGKCSLSPIYNRQINIIFNSNRILYLKTVYFN